MLFLDRQDVRALLPIADCIAAVERAFAAHATGELPAAPGVLGVHVADGGFHVKTATLGSGPGYHAAKINANFPANPDRHSSPTTQGMIGLFDASYVRRIQRVLAFDRDPFRAGHPLARDRRIRRGPVPTRLPEASDQALDRRRMRDAVSRPRTAAGNPAPMTWHVYRSILATSRSS